MTSKSCRFTVDKANGLLEPARRCASPNCDERPDGTEPTMIVVHGISLPPGQFGGPEIEALFTNTLDWDAHPYFGEIRGLEVSSHLLIRRRCNDFSIGIELEGEDETPYEDRQYDALQGVIRALCAAYPAISPREIAGHCDIAPGRKTDPGPAFDWFRLYDGLVEDNDPV